MTEPYEPEHLRNHRPRLRSARQTFVDEACAFVEQQRKAGRHTLAFTACGYGGVKGIDFQRGAGAFYDYVAFQPNDEAVDHKVGKRLLREAMRPRNGLRTMLIAPIFILLISVIWDVFWYFWTRR